MEQISEDQKYMHRCLQLARNGRSGAKPNPMVGAVIVAGGRIIGEGYHVHCGEGHAEVNAFASVSPADEHLLAEATMYVSLEPCSHYGRTPPCADLIIKKGVRRVVVGCEDPFAKVHGRGIEKLREAGIDVTVGVLEDECRELNKRFITFNTRHRPYVLIKWARTANGYIDDNMRPAVISSPFTRMLSHKLRAENDAILVGRVTAERDNPQLTVRYWYGNDPLRIVIDRNHPFFPELDFSYTVVPQILAELYRRGVESLIVEGGHLTIASFVRSRMWDEMRVETSPKSFDFGTGSPDIPGEAAFERREMFDGRFIDWFRNAERLKPEDELEIFEKLEEYRRYSRLKANS